MTTKVVTLYGAVSLPGGGFLNPAGQESAGRVLSHEWGHCLLGLWDEYRDHGVVKECAHGDDQCTQTAMANHNLMFNLCNDFTHARDPGGDPDKVLHVCSSCTAQFPPYLPGWETCSDHCATCSLQTPSAWNQVMLNGLVYSYPNQTQNIDQYFTNESFPFSVLVR